MIWESIKMALLSIRAAKLRSFLTMFGIIIGIASVVAINSVGEGFKQQITGQIEGLGTNIIGITPGQTLSSSDEHDRARPNPAASFGSSTLTEKDLEAISQVEHEAARDLTGDNLQILRIFAQIDDAANVEPAVEPIKAALKKSHGGQEDFSVLTQEELVGTVSSLLDLASGFIAAIAAIALIVGGIGIMNIMLVAVTERTREIGIRKALGATRAMIMTQFLIEAMVISLLGGGLGVLAAHGLGQVAGHLTKIPPIFTLDGFVAAAGIAVGIGIVFGLTPAVKAARKSPLEALRYE